MNERFLVECVKRDFEYGGGPVKAEVRFLDIFGNGATWEDCRTDCRNSDSECATWTYYPATKKCILYPEHELKTLTAATGAISGEKNCPGE